MPTTTIKTEIDDGPLKKFAETYSKVHEQIKELPGDWGKLDGRINMTETRFQRLAAILMTQQAVMHQQNSELTKQEKAQRALEKAERDRQKNAEKILNTMKETAKTVGKITLDMFKWIDIGAIAGGIFGAWGMDKLAQSISDSRRTALGLGVSTADMQALKLNLQRYTDVPTNLEDIAGAKSDLSKMWAFRALGMNDYQNMDPSQILVQAIQKAQDLAKRTHGHFVLQDPYVRALGIMGFGPDDIRRLGNLQPGELQKAIGQYRTDRSDKQGFLSDAANRKWQDLLVAIERFGLKLKNAFANWLTPVVSELPKLYDAIFYFVEKIFGNQQMKSWVDQLATDIRQFADWLEGPEAKKAFDDFMTGMTNMAQKVMDWLPQFDQIMKALNIMATFINNTFGPQAGKTGEPAVTGADVGAVTGKTTGFKKQWQQDLYLAGWFAKNLGTTPSVGMGLVANLRNEDDNLDPFREGDFVKGKGYTAYGLAMWHKYRQDQMASYFGWSEGFHKHMDMLKAKGAAGRDEAMQDELKFILHELSTGSYKSVLENMKLNPKMGASRAAELFSEGWEGARGRSGNALIEGHRRGEYARGLVVYINNNTGGAVHTQVALLQ